MRRWIKKIHLNHRALFYRLVLCYDSATLGSVYVDYAMRALIKKLESFTVYIFDACIPDLNHKLLWQYFMSEDHRAS